MNAIVTYLFFQKYWTLLLVFVLAWRINDVASVANARNHGELTLVEKSRIRSKVALRWFVMGLLV